MTKTPLERNYLFLSALIRIRYAAAAAELKPALASRLRALVVPHPRALIPASSSPSCFCLAAPGPRMTEGCERPSPLPCRRDPSGPPGGAQRPALPAACGRRALAPPRRLVSRRPASASQPRPGNPPPASQPPPGCQATSGSPCGLASSMII
jgi:hypothetical protein